MIRPNASGYHYYGPKPIWDEIQILYPKLLAVAAVARQQNPGFGECSYIEQTQIQVDAY